MKTILYQPIFINPQAYFVFPLILTVKDNNQVDFSIFAGKHIRISQYTDEGAVVLGEWELPANTNTIEKQEETEDNTIELINYDKTRKS